MIELLLLLGLLAGGGAFAVKEVKTNFSTSRAIGAKINAVLHGPPTPEKRAEQLLSKYASHVDGMREGISQLVAHQVQSRKIALEEGQVAHQARAIAERSLQEGNERTARQAIVLAVNSEARAVLHEENAAKLVRIIERMKEELENSEAELETAQTTVDTIRIHAQIAGTNRQLYELVSNISAESGGFSTQGSLKQLAEQTERDAFASAAKIELARQDQSGRTALKRMLAGGRAEEEFEAMRKALPPGRKESGDEEGGEGKGEEGRPS